MRYRHSVLTIALAAISACGGDAATAPTSPHPPGPTVLLKDIVIPNLPSPFYHFEYDGTGRIDLASFASGFARYDVKYDAGRLSEMRNSSVNQGTLTYSYDAAGRVDQVSYVDGSGVTFARVHLHYDGRRLTRLDRERTLAGAFVTDKTMSFSYDADGNLFELTEHFAAVPGIQNDATSVDRYEQYDAGINVDGFSLIHDEFFDHLVLLPDVQLQKTNPRRQTHTGDGDNYVVDYTYDYDDQKRPRSKSGDLAFLTGPDAGRHFQIGSTFTYY